MNALNSSSNAGPSPLECGADNVNDPSSRAFTNRCWPNWIAIDPVISDTSLHIHHPPFAIASSSTTTCFGFFSLFSFLSFFCFRFFDLQHWKRLQTLDFRRILLDFIKILDQVVIIFLPARDPGLNLLFFFTSKLQLSFVMELIFWHV